MAKLTIVADITAKPDKIEMVKSELLTLLGPTREEIGCVNYILHQDNFDPAHFVLYENWTSHEHWRAHMETHHITSFSKAIEGALESISVKQLSQLELH